MTNNEAESFFSASVAGEPRLQVERHGRVNLIGEHTDYNRGFVLPMLIAQSTRITLAKRDDARVRIASREFPSEGAVEYALGDEAVDSQRRWFDHVMGVTHILRQAGFEKQLSGFEAWIESDVPVGSGLSSSAALEIALLNGLFDLFSLPDDKRSDIPFLGQQVENDFIGARVGIMDQMVIHHARFGEAMFLDTATMDIRNVALPAIAEWVVINSGVAHNHSQGDYNTRRSECEAACEMLGVGSLRECTVADLDRINAIPEPFCLRARHVITENARVVAAVDAIEKSDLVSLGQLMHLSHRSQRDDYRVSVSEIDALVDIAMKLDGVYGARLTGGGFGGSIVALVREKQGKEIGSAIIAEYARKFDTRAQLLSP